MKPQKLQPGSNIDYKELQKTLIQFQRAQLKLEKTRQGSPIKIISPVREMINFQALQQAGLIELNEYKQQVDGVKVTLKEIEKSFKILNEKNKGQKISLLELKKKIPAINPNFPKSEIKALTQDKPELRSKDLYELLKQMNYKISIHLNKPFQLLDPNEQTQRGFQMCLTMGLQIKEILKFYLNAWIQIKMEKSDYKISEKYLNKRRISGKLNIYYQIYHKFISQILAVPSDDAVIITLLQLNLQILSLCAFSSHIDFLSQIISSILISCYYNISQY